MHRFGRSAQQKMKDRWGGGFILATILALVGAWYAGTWLNNVWKGDTAGTDLGGNGVIVDNGSGDHVAVGNPGSFDLHLVQVGAFRSQASAQKLATTLSGKGENALVAKSADGLYKVYAGLFMNADEAVDAKTRVAADVTSPFVTKVSINQMPEAITVANMKDTTQAAEVKKGLETMTSYLYEAARWVESGSADTAALTAKGKELAKMADTLKKMNNAALDPYVKLATDASTNATAIEAAAKAALGSKEYMNAMTGYMALVDEYRGLSGAHTAPATGN